MSIADKLTTIAENQQAVYDAGYAKGQSEGGGGDYDSGFEDGYDQGWDTGFSNGWDEGYNDGEAVGIEQGKQAGEDAMWDIIQANGTRTNYTTAFNEWMLANTLNTKYPVNTISLYETFRWCENLEHLPVVISSNADGKYNSCYCAFYRCGKLKSIDLDIYNKASGSLAWGYAFADCYELVRIQKLGIVANQGFTNTFNNCRSLTEIRIDGEIGQSGLDLHWSTKLSKESIISIIDALSDTTSGLSITLSKTAVDAISAAEAEDYGDYLSSLKPNWTINLV